MKNSIVILLAVITVLLASNLFSGYAPSSIAITESPGKYQISAWAAPSIFGNSSTTEYGYFIIDTTTGQIVSREKFLGK